MAKPGHTQASFIIEEKLWSAFQQRVGEGNYSKYLSQLVYLFLAGETSEDEVRRAIASNPTTAWDAKIVALTERLEILEERLSKICKEREIESENTTVLGGK